MTDSDVVERVAAMIGVSVQSTTRGSFKPQFRVAIKAAPAVDLMLELQPIMSARRGAAITEAISMYAPAERKLDRMAAEEIRDLYALGSSVSWLSRVFGVRRVTIRQVVSETIYYDDPAARRLDLESDHFAAPDPSPQTPLSSQELYWLAGWLEGEGSFVQPPPSDPRRVRILGDTRDADVAAEVGRLLGVKPLYSHPAREQRLGWSPIWRLLCRGSRAVALMTALRPVLGARRQSQIDTALGAVSMA